MGKTRGKWVSPQSRGYRQVWTNLTDAEYARFKRVCEREGVALLEKVSELMRAYGMGKL